MFVLTLIIRSCGFALAGIIGRIKLPMDEDLLLSQSFLGREKNYCRHHEFIIICRESFGNFVDVPEPSWKINFHSFQKFSIAYRFCRTDPSHRLSHSPKFLRVDRLLNFWVQPSIFLAMLLHHEGIFRKIQNLTKFCKHLDFDIILRGYNRLSFYRNFTYSGRIIVGNDFFY